jgi:hypothetical protein
MGYIIDLTLVLNELFLADFSMTPPCPLTNAEIDKALENYKNLNLGRVHHDIRQYVRKASVGQILESDAAEMKVKELILKYSSDRNRTSAKTW